MQFVITTPHASWRVDPSRMYGTIEWQLRTVNGAEHVILRGDGLTLLVVFATDGQIFFWMQEDGQPAAPCDPLIAAEFMDSCLEAHESQDLGNVDLPAHIVSFLNTL